MGDGDSFVVSLLHILNVSAMPLLALDVEILFNIMIDIIMDVHVHIKI